VVPPTLCLENDNAKEEMLWMASHVGNYLNDTSFTNTTHEVMLGYKEKEELVNIVRLLMS